jgi:hypothetical protein
VLLAHAVLRELYSRATARLGATLLAASPWLIFLGMSYMAHAATLSLALAAALGVVRARRTQSAGAALLAGCALGGVSLMRPLEGLIGAIVLGLWSLGARGRAWRFLPSVALTAGAVAIGALTLPYNAALTGKAGRFPVMDYFDRTYGPGVNDMGFGPNRGMGWVGLDPFPGHGLRDVIVNSLFNGFAINVELFGWATGSILIIAAFVVSSRMRRVDAGMLAVIVTVAGLHAFYWFSGGPDFGARYWFLAIVPCVALTANGTRCLFVQGRTRDAARDAVLALTVVSQVVFVPWRAIDKYRGYRGVSGGFAAFAEASHFGRSLVLVRGSRHPDYHMAALENPIDVNRAETVIAFDRSLAIRDSVLRAFPDRPVYVVDGPSVTGRGFAVSAGPIRDRDALRTIPSWEELRSRRATPDDAPGREPRQP